MSIKIRPAIKKDINELERLENTVFETDMISKRQFAYHINPDQNIFLVAESQRESVGYILIFIRKNSHRARIYSLAVDPKQQGQGIASKLCKAAIKKIKEKHAIQTISLEVNVNNTPAIKLYAKLGFEISGTHPNYYENGDDAFLMKLDI